MKIVEYSDSYKNDVKKLFKELQEYIVAFDPYKFNVLQNGYEDKIFEIDMLKINKNNGKIYIALEDNDVVGFIMRIIYEPEIEFDFIRNTRKGEVIELIVTKEIRSKGIGKFLIEQVEKYFRDNGCKTINIDVFGYNDLAQDFYHKNGYHNRMVTVSKKMN